MWGCSWSLRAFTAKELKTEGEELRDVKGLVLRESERVASLWQVKQVESRHVWLPWSPLAHCANCGTAHDADGFVARSTWSFWNWVVSFKLVCPAAIELIYEPNMKRWMQVCWTLILPHVGPLGLLCPLVIGWSSPSASLRFRFGSCRSGFGVENDVFLPEEIDCGFGIWPRKDRCFRRPKDGGAIHFHADSECMLLMFLFWCGVFFKK